MYALGKDINDFYNYHFPDGYYMEDEEIDLESNLNDKDLLNLEESKKYDLSLFGYLVANDGKQTKFETLFKEYLKNKTVTSVVIEIPNNQLDVSIKSLKTFFPNIKIVIKN